jgi:hypothetical protein
VQIQKVKYKKYVNRPNRNIVTIGAYIKYIFLNKINKITTSHIDNQHRPSELEKSAQSSTSQT